MMIAIKPAGICVLGAIAFPPACSTICYIKKVFNSGFSKCRLVASSVSFFFKQILKRPYDLPSKLYPRKQFKLPNVMTSDEIRHLLNVPSTLKQQAILQLFYSSGVRVEECSRIKITDIDSRTCALKWWQAKARKTVTLCRRPLP